MSIRCENVHRFELPKSFTFWVGSIASVPEAPFSSYSCISNFGHVCLKLNFVLIPRLTGKCATHNLKNLRNPSLWICSYLMDILRSQNKNTDF